MSGRHRGSSKNAWTPAKVAAQVLTWTASHQRKKFPRPARQPESGDGAIIHGRVREMRGSVSAEPGIGTPKKAWSGHARSEAAIALMRTAEQRAGSASSQAR
jgi:hypothetical protein